MFKRWNVKVKKKVKKKKKKITKCRKVWKQKKNRINFYLQKMINANDFKTILICMFTFTLYKTIFYNIVFVYSQPKQIEISSSIFIFLFFFWFDIYSIFIHLIYKNYNIVRYYIIYMSKYRFCYGKKKNKNKTV